MHLLIIAGLRVVLGADHVVLGPNAPREVTITVEGAQGTLHIAANVGNVAAPVDAGGGRWRVSWTPPREPYPQVALFGVWDEADAEMAVLPLWGAARLPVQVDVKDAEVTLEVSGRRFVGHTDRAGAAEIAFEAPPGPRVGMVRATDRLGNVKAKVVELGIPDTQRILMIAPPAAVADGRTAVAVHIFAAAPAGEPDGSLVVPGARVISPGVAIAELPARRELGVEKVAAQTGTQKCEATVRWVVGPPAAIDASARGGEDGTWTVTARVVDVGDHVVASPLSARAAGGTLDASAAPDGALETHYRPARAHDPGELVFTAGSIERRLLLEPVSGAQVRWTARALTTSNLGHVFAAGALLGGELMVWRRVGLMAETGVVLASGDVPTGASFSFAGVPLRFGVDVAFSPPRAWQPFGGVHAQLLLLSASTRGAMGPEISEGEVAAGGGVEIGVRRRVGTGALLISLGWDYTPVVSGDRLSGSLTGLTGAFGYRL